MLSTVPGAGVRAGTKTDKAFCSYIIEDDKHNYGNNLRNPEEQEESKTR